MKPILRIWIVLFTITGTGSLAVTGAPSPAPQPPDYVFSSPDAIQRDSNGWADVFVMQGGRIERVSIGRNGEEPNGPSGYPSITPGGHRSRWQGIRGGRGAGDQSARPLRSVHRALHAIHP